MRSTRRIRGDRPDTLRGEEFRIALKRVGLDLRSGAEFLGVSERQCQRIAARVGFASVAASKLLKLMYDRDLFPSDL